MARVYFWVLLSAWESSCCCCVQLGDVVMNRCKLAFGRVLAQKVQNQQGSHRGRCGSTAACAQTRPSGARSSFMASRLSHSQLWKSSSEALHSFGFTIQNGWEASIPQTARQPRKQPSVSTVGTGTVSPGRDTDQVLSHAPRLGSCTKRQQTASFWGGPGRELLSWRQRGEVTFC